MKTVRVASTAAFLDPAAAGWSGIKQEEVPMVATPLAMQPTEYIRKSWEGKAYGKVDKVSIASVHDGETWALRASWAGVSPAGKDFPDALAIALPVSGKPALATMGAPNAPIHFLRWQANKAEVRSILATGIGQSQHGPELKRGVKAVAKDDIWTIVITRALGHGKEVAPLAAGHKTGIGFAIWHGGNDERAGIKAFSIDWTELMLDA